MLCETEPSINALQINGYDCMTQKQLLKKLIHFLSLAPTPFHAVRYLTELLDARGFRRLFEGDRWQLGKGESYYLVRDDAALVAFRLGKDDLPVEGVRIIGAHTDSPALKIKPSPALSFKNYLKLGVEVYGSPILSSWFDRDLSIAGRVVYTNDKNQSGTDLVDFKRPLAVIPSLPIHLSPSKTGASDPLNRQTDLPPLLMQFDSKKQPSPSKAFSDVLLTELMKQQPGVSIERIDDADLILYDTQAPVLTGYNQEFICGGRLDNLVSCFVGLLALADSDNHATAMLVCNDHEEIGSNSLTGAAGPFLKSILERMLKTTEDYYRCVSRSVLVSVDNAHGVHPNYAHRFDENHGPILNQGPVLKINAGRRYATSAITGSQFRKVCRAAGVPLQEFVNRSDLPCGSTIGPITSTNLGIDTLDIGIPTFAMHSIRETAGCRDVLYLYKGLVGLLRQSGRADGH